MRMDLDDLDEIVEQILDIVKRATDWEFNIVVARLVHKARRDIDTDILNIRGILRDLIKTLLDTVKKNELQKSQVIKMDELAKERFMEAYGDKK